MLYHPRCRGITCLINYARSLYPRPIQRAELLQEIGKKRRVFLLIFLTPDEVCSLEIGEVLTLNWAVHGLVTSRRPLICHLAASLVPSIYFDCLLMFQILYFYFLEFVSTSNGVHIEHVYIS